MTEEEQIKKIKEIYDEAIRKIDVLNEERNALLKNRKDIVRGYIKDLETKKMDAIRSSIGLLTNN